MLPRGERLRKTREIKKVLRGGKKFETGLFKISVQNTNAGSFKCAVICPKSVDRRSTRRNMLKRRTQSIVGNVLKKAFPAAEIVIHIKPGAASAKYADLEREIKNVLHI